MKTLKQQLQESHSFLREGHLLDQFIIPTIRKWLEQKRQDLKESNEDRLDIRFKDAVAITAINNYIKNVLLEELKQ